jgi:hypothetical protein
VSSPAHERDAAWARHRHSGQYAWAREAHRQALDCGQAGPLGPLGPAGLPGTPGARLVICAEPEDPLAAAWRASTTLPLLQFAPAEAEDAASHFEAARDRGGARPPVAWLCDGRSCGMPIRSTSALRAQVEALARPPEDP